MTIFPSMSHVLTVAISNLSILIVTHNTGNWNNVTEVALYKICSVYQMAALTLPLYKICSVYQMTALTLPLFSHGISIIYTHMS